MKISNEDKQKLKELISELYINQGIDIKFKKAIQVQDDYRIEIVDE